MNRNWNNICNITNQLLKMTLSTIVLSTEEGEKLIATFPECFSEEGDGAIPMSILLERERQNFLESGDESWTLGKFLVSHSAIPRDIPTFEYGFDEWAANEWNVPILPEHIDRSTPVGSIVEIKGASFVVVENNDNDCVDVMYIVPAECIFLDTEVKEEDEQNEQLIRQNKARSRQLHKFGQVEGRLTEAQIEATNLHEDMKNMLRFDCGLPMKDEAKKKIEDLADVLLNRLRMISWASLSEDI